MTLRARFEAHVGEFELAVGLDADDELVVLYGRSGSGKSLTLRAIAGLLRPRSGRIEIGGRTVFDAAAGVDLPPQQRRSGYVVQEPTLFPHLDLRRNVLIGLERDVDAPARYEELLRLLSIEGLDGRRPHQLSGGQQQRAALARALVRRSDVLLLDEPFSALDEALRADLRAELLRLRREMRLSIVFVTHDLREAHLLADRIAVLDEGRVLQFAARDEVFRRPASRLVAELTGFSNIFEAERRGEGVVVAGLPLRTELPPGVAEAEAVDVAIRAERVVLRRLDPDGGLPENCFVASVVDDLAFGNTHTLHLVPDGAGPPIAVEVASRPYEILGVARRERWVVELPADDLHVMSRGAGAPE
ncbi:MAG: ABC transporter ATP-binding protein [Chloroflexi bacterium]|nr:ABC transporter ATP-binding protein [Chloroflexota bacterium]